MRKGVIFILIMLLAVCALAGCGNEEENNQKPVTYKIGLVVEDTVIEEDSLMEEVWEGVIEFGETNGISHKYFTPIEDNTQGYMHSIKEAADSGAEVIVIAGYQAEEALSQAQSKYPKIDFIYIDGEMKPAAQEKKSFRWENNVLKITFAEEEAGYLAGYAAVRDGYWKLGFMGGQATEAVKDYGYGFVQGVEDAAEEMGVTDLTLRYRYMGDMEASEKAMKLAADWYESGTEVIFGCGNTLVDSVVEAAEDEDGKVIGVNFDQSEVSDTIITSAMKNLKRAVAIGLQRHFDGEFEGGKVMELDISQDGIMLPMEDSEFEKFSENNYEKIFDRISEGTVEVLNSEETSLSRIPLEIIVLETQ